MSELQENQDLGTPQNQQLKKLVKEKADAKKGKKYEKVFYTLQAGKVLKVTAKPHGACTEFVGSKKKNEEMFKASIAKWKKEEVWISEDDYEDTISLAVMELQEQKTAAKKK